MAWVTQKFEHNGLEVVLAAETVVFQDDGHFLELCPKTSAGAHAQAMMLRRAARRLEEIGNGLD